MSNNNKTAVLLLKLEKHICESMMEFAEEEKVDLDVAHFAMVAASIMKNVCFQSDDSPFESNPGLQKCFEIQKHILKEHKAN